MRMKTCPFCLAGKKHREQKAEGLDRFVRCNKCGATGPNAYTPLISNILWNTRPTAKKIPPLNVEFFEMFRNAWPEDHFEGTGAARASFQKLNPSESMLKKIVAAVESKAKSPQWMKDNGAFIPHPATWLNQERWTDDTYQPPAGVFSTDEELGF